MTYTMGFEFETAGRSVPFVKAELQARGIKGCKVVVDTTPSVDAEIVTPPLAPCQTTWEYLEKLCKALEEMGCKVNERCGLHVHISNARLKENVTPAQFTGTSIAHAERTGGYHTDHADPMDAALLKDVMLRYTEQQDAVNSMLPCSRRDNYMTRLLSPARILRANTIDELKAATHGKFSTINLVPWSTYGTIEFRQAAGTIEFEKAKNWGLFLINLIEWSEAERVETGSRTIVTPTPEQPFRRGARVGVQYTMMRRPGGATTREIMMVTGCSEQRVRSAVSEIRTRVGDFAVVTNTQQANGASYGSGTDHTSYHVLEEWAETATGATLLPDHRIGNPSIWAGICDNQFEWWQDRIAQIEAARLARLARLAR